MYLKFQPDKWGNQMIVNTANITTVNRKTIKDGDGKAESVEISIYCIGSNDCVCRLRTPEDVPLFDDWLNHR